MKYHYQFQEHRDVLRSAGKFDAVILVEMVIYPLYQIENSIRSLGNEIKFSIPSEHGSRNDKTWTKDNHGETPKV